MLKKSQLSERLKKLKMGEGASANETIKPDPSERLEPVKEKVSSISKRTKTKVKIDRIKALKIKEKPAVVKISKPKPKSPVVEKVKEVEKIPVPVDAEIEEPILQVKEVDKIKETKPKDLIDSLMDEDIDFRGISDFAIPLKKFSKIFKAETSYTDDSLTQIFTAWKNPEKVLKWTVKHDKEGKEFYSLRSEGLVKMKDDPPNPPIYGIEFDDGGLITTHIEGYTFTMGCYSFELRALVKIFSFGIENAKKFFSKS